MSLPDRSELVPIVALAVREEVDIVAARQRARQIAAELGFRNQEQVCIATAVSEIARNAFQYAGGGRIQFSVTPHLRPPMIVVEVSDNGPGIPDIDAVLSGDYKSTTGMGIGLAGTRRLMDVFDIESQPAAGTRVRFGKTSSNAPSISRETIQRLSANLAAARPPEPSTELYRQNRELLETLQNLRQREAELHIRQEELQRSNLELEETNRGVVALYAELDEKNAALSRADELKSRFLSHVSHEFRTPVNSILALTQLLLEHADGPLEPEQERQVGFIRKSAQELAEMVNDLLDLAKVESGKTEIHRARVDVSQLFGALRGILRPLTVNEAVALVFDDPPPGMALLSDETKITQILRNLISNALKFTERGEVRISAQFINGGAGIAMTVADTGIGIPEDDHDKIFQEFTQVFNPLQRKVKGTGLGLPLSRKLAHLLDGSLEVRSALGRGAAFTLSLPTGLAPSAELADDPSNAPAVLIIDDQEAARYLGRQLFRGSHYRIIEASTGAEGAELARFERPALILLDLSMAGRNGFDVLDELKSDPSTANIPVVIHTSRILREADLERLADRHVTVLPKSAEGRRQALDIMRRLLGEPGLFAHESGSVNDS